MSQAKEYGFQWQCIHCVPTKVLKHHQYISVHTTLHVLSIFFQSQFSSETKVKVSKTCNSFKTSQLLRETVQVMLVNAAKTQSLTNSREAFTERLKIQRWTNAEQATADEKPCSLVCGKWRKENQTKDQRSRHLPPQNLIISKSSSLDLNFSSFI